MSKFKAAIFDMDGLLIDSELYWDKCISKFFDSYGIVRNAEVQNYLFGKSMRETVLWLKNTFNLPQDYEKILADYISYSDPIYSTLSSPMAGATEILAVLDEANYRLAVASGSPLERVRKVVKHFGWGKFFDELVSTDHVNYVGKPDPAIYNYTAKAFNIRPDECVVLEDSLNGVKAAKAAGMSCVAVPDPRWSKGDFSMADAVVASLADKNLLSFLGL